MRVILCDDKASLADGAADTGSRWIREAIAKKGKAVIVLSTGLSQVDMLSRLVKADIPWDKVEAFHVDEYVGLPTTDTASFHSYLETYFVKRIPSLGEIHFIDGNAKDIESEIARLNALIAHKTVDVAFIGVGENGHIAFNDPPMAKIHTEESFIQVTLADRCRRQQVAEGWFSSMDAVPQQAITMSVRQILKAKHIIASVPDLRKAKAVAMCLFDEASPFAPCAMLRWHNGCDLFIDRPSATLVLGDRRPE
jgi:glucosamine-6-phosphate deaminase